MTGVREGVLHVQLEVVVLPRGHALNDVLEGLYLRHLVPGDVEHHATMQVVGPIGDLAFGNRAVVGPPWDPGVRSMTKLREGGPAVPEAIEVSRQ